MGRENAGRNSTIDLRVVDIESKNRTKVSVKALRHARKAASNSRQTKGPFCVFFMAEKNLLEVLTREVLSEREWQPPVAKTSLN
jgi:hypothetical protein